MLRRTSILILGFLFGFFIIGAAHAAQDRTSQAGGSANIFSPSLCFTLKIPGNWVPGREEGTYLSPDRKQFVGVLTFRSKDLKRAKGDTLVEKEAWAVESAYNKDLKGKLTDVKLAPFDPAFERTWKWTAAFPGDRNHEGFHAPQRYIIDLSPDGVVVLNIQGTPDDDALARTIIESLRTSPARPCQLPTNLKSLLRDVMRQSSPPQAPALSYKNPAFPWSVRYPEGWELRAADTGQVQIIRPGPGDEAGCSIFSVAVQFSTVDEFADFWRTQADQHMRGQGIHVRRISRQPVALPNGVTAVEVLSEMPAAGGRSRAVYVLSDGVGYAIDCETSVKNWDSVAPFFAQIINSFAVEKKK